jgi:hypothetical protein
MLRRAKGCAEKEVCRIQIPYCRFGLLERKPYSGRSYHTSTRCEEQCANGAKRSVWLHFAFHKEPCRVGAKELECECEAAMLQVLL